jgi:hypothetical protein
VILITAGLILWRPGLPKGPPLRIVLAVGPFLVIGVLCSLLLSAYGAPFPQWTIPALATLALGLFCRSERAFRYATYAFLIATVALCWTFGGLISSEFTADPGRTLNLEGAIQWRAIKAASRELGKLSGVFPEGPVSGILQDRRYDTVQRPMVESQWHTPLTGLYRVCRDKGYLWYPGGDVVIASRQIRWRPTNP